MTIPEYLQAALEASGLSEYELCKRNEFCMNTTRLKSYLKGECVPLVNTLLKIEAVSGLNLDLVDARIKRGMAYFRELDKHICASGNSIREIAEALGVGHEALRKWAVACHAGKPPERLKPSIAINLCDWVGDGWKSDGAGRALIPWGVCKYREENSRSNQCTGDFRFSGSSGSSDAARDWCQPDDTRRAVETIERFNMGPVRLRKLKKVEDSLHTFNAPETLQSKVPAAPCESCGFQQGLVACGKPPATAVKYGPYDCTLDLRGVPGVFRAVYRKTGCVSVYREI